MDKPYKVAVVVGVPRVNDQGDRAVTLLNAFSLLMESKRFNEMHGMYADHAPRIAAQAHFKGASCIIALDPKCRRACRNASKRINVPVFFWDAKAQTLVDSDGAAWLAGCKS